MLAKNILSFRARFTYLCKFASTSVSEKCFEYNPKFSAQEQEKILDILNKANPEEMSRFDVTKTRIKKLHAWRNKNGPFASLPEILEVDGLGVNILDRLCQSILTAGSDKQTDVVQRNHKYIVTPSLSADEVNDVKSAVGLHLGPTGLSWAKMHRSNNELDSWNFYDLSKLPRNILPSDTFNLTMQILQLIPQADIYILETVRMNQLKKSPSIASTCIHQLEMASMLMALINTSERHNPRVDKNAAKCSNKVYHMRSLLSARLFKTLVGNEKVSTAHVVSNLISGSESLLSPCEPIHVDQKLQDYFNNCHAADCDLLGQALLLVISFMNLCVYKTPSSLSAIRRGRYI